jgi:hypothetical protein
MSVLVACEFSGVVRDAFRRRGHVAYSLDILPAEPSPFAKYHIQQSLERLPATIEWDLIVAHPPCTYLTVSNNRAMAYGCRKYTADEGQRLREAGVSFFRMCTRLPAKRLCIENPIGIMSTLYRKPDQVVQPWQYGHGETKATCLWLHNLPRLVPTNVVSGRDNRIHMMSPSDDRGRLRSITYTGIAEAMADQWGVLL